MFAMFFFITLYLQNTLGYGPLDAGIRFLPWTAMIMVVAPIAGRLSDRIGSRPLMTTGLLLTTVSLFWQSRLDVTWTYGDLWPSFVVMGVGTGLVMSPMNTAAMNAVDRTKAGVASGAISMSRMVGGTFGVTVLGAIIAAVGRNTIEDRLPGLPADMRERVVESLGFGVSVQGASPELAAASQQAFIDALGTALTLSAAISLVATVLAWTLVAKRPAPEPQAEAVPAAA
jgi:MFS family permease